jgi:hypothetical protein
MSNHMEILKGYINVTERATDFILHFLYIFSIHDFRSDKHFKKHALNYPLKFIQTFTTSVFYFRMSSAEHVKCWRFSPNLSNTKFQLHQFGSSLAASCVQTDGPIFQIALQVCECSKEEQK